MTGLKCHSWLMVHVLHDSMDTSVGIVCSGRACRSGGLSPGLSRSLHFLILRFCLQGSLPGSDKGLAFCIHEALCLSQSATTSEWCSLPLGLRCLAPETQGRQSSIACDKTCYTLIRMKLHLDFEISHAIIWFLANTHTQTPARAHCISFGLQHSRTRGHVLPELEYVETTVLISTV